MNILYVVPYVPTPIRTRPYNLIRHLAQRGHRISLATLWQDAAERASLDRLQDEGIQVLSAHLTRTRSAWNCSRTLATSMPLQASYCWHPDLMRQIRSALQSPSSRLHLIHIEHLRGSRYGLALQAEGKTALPPVIWDSVDCISYLFEQAASRSSSPSGKWMTRFELGRTRRYEALLRDTFSRVLVTSSVDKQALEDLGLRTGPEAPGQVSVLPNGVDLDHFCPSDQPRDANTIVFSGKMSYHANITAAQYLINDVMPRVWQQRRDAQVQIVGKDPGASLRRLTNDARVSITGTVPDLVPYLQRATLSVAPMPYGAGIQNKVLEAMACATPVVASPQAVAALPIRNGEHALVADGAEALARQILVLLNNPDLRSRIARSGYRYVFTNHSWTAIAAQLEAIYADTIASSSVVAPGDEPWSLPSNKARLRSAQSN